MTSNRSTRRKQKTSKVGPTKNATPTNSARAKQKASPQRKSAKQKAFLKRKPAKQKASPERKSAKQKSVKSRKAPSKIVEKKVTTKRTQTVSTMPDENQTLDTIVLSYERIKGASAGQAGDLQGLSGVEGAD